MPYVNIKIAGPEPTKEQKDQVFQEVTDTLVRVLGKKKRGGYDIFRDSRHQQHRRRRREHRG